MMTKEVGELSQMEITTRLNGEVMQNATADLLVHGFDELIVLLDLYRTRARRCDRDWDAGGGGRVSRRFYGPR